MRFVLWSLRILVFLLLFLFAIKNTDPVSIRFFLDSNWHAPLIIVGLAFFAGGALLDIGVYALSLMRSFMAETPDQVMSQVRFAPTGTDEQASIILMNKEQQMAAITLSMHSKQPKPKMLLFSGTIPAGMPSNPIQPAGLRNIPNFTTPV